VGLCIATRRHMAVSPTFLTDGRGCLQLLEINTIVVIAWEVNHDSAIYLQEFHIHSTLRGMVVSERLDRFELNHNISIDDKVGPHLPYLHPFKHDWDDLLRLVGDVVFLEKNFHSVMVDTLAEASAEALEDAFGEGLELLHLEWRMVLSWGDGIRFLCY